MIASWIIFVGCITAIVIVKLGTSHVEKMEKIKHGYPVDGVSPVKDKDTLDYRSVNGN